MPLVSDCSIGDNWTADGDWYAPDPRDGFFSYKSVCPGTVMSIRARGLCPRPPENTTVIMQILNSTILNEGGIKLVYDILNLTAECNYSSPIKGSDYYEGYARHDDVSIRVPDGSFLGVEVKIFFFSPEGSSSSRSQKASPLFHYLYSWYA